MWNRNTIEHDFKSLATKHDINPKELMLPLRIMITGTKSGPDIFSVMEIIGRQECIERINKALAILNVHNTPRTHIR